MRDEVGRDGVGGVREWEKHNGEGLPLGWSLGMPLGCCLKLTDLERPSLLWVAPFTMQRVLNCVNEETELSTSQ